MSDDIIRGVYSILLRVVKHYKSPVVELIKLKNGDPYKVLVSAMISARTRDELTLKACEKLFKKANSFKELSELSVEEVEQLIYPVGFYRVKARNLKMMSELLKNKPVPRTFEELIKLPGVGRKTANLVLAVAFNKPAIAVDTHVHRIMNRLGYVKTKTPEETEKVLRRKLPEKYWRKINYLLVAHGQNVCKPLVPNCSKCAINHLCPRIGVTKNK